MLALSPFAGYALGLGKLEMKSALNEPLNAEIDITSIDESELKGLNVSLAPRADFDAAGAQRIPLLTQIKFTVARRPDGRYYLQLKTDAPIEEPFLHMLLQLEWPGGRLVREYTALIDPPNYIAGTPATVEAPQTVPPAVAATPPPSSTFVETVPPPTSEQSEAQAAMPAAPIPEPLAARAPEPQPDSVVPPPDQQLQEQAIAVPAEPSLAQPDQTAASGEPAAPASDWANLVQYTVRPGDTLWSISERVRTDKQLTLEQVMLAIFRNNPEAFYRDNVNNLRAGKVLTMPERDAVATMPVRDARREFRAQYDAWREYKLKLAAGSRTLQVAESAAAAPSAPSESTSAPKADAKSEAATSDAPKAAEAAKPSEEELLKIVRSAADADKTAAPAAETEAATESRERTALAERATTLEESLQSKQLENRELAEKVGQVRSQIKNEKRLIELENQALAQQTAKPAEAKPEAPPQAKAEPAPTPAPAPAAAPKQPPAAAPAAPVKAAPRKPIPRPAPPPPPEPGLIAFLLDDLLASSFLPLVGGAVVLFGGLILIVYMRRRRRSIAEFEESILASDAIASEAPATTAENSAQPTSGDTSFLSDFSKGGMGQVHTDEVDPVAEAEVYLAYGRDETAEEILKEAIVKNPERQELKQKLLEIYHQRNDVNAFETLAEELYAAVGGGRGGKLWEQVEKMGRKLNPENPMFRGGTPERRAPDRGPPAGPPILNLDSAEVEASAATQVVEKAPSINFDFEAAPPAPSAESVGLNFELNTDALEPDAAPADKGAGAESARAAADFESLDLETAADNLIDFEGSKSEAPVLADTDTAPAAADEEIKWDVDAPLAAAPPAEAPDAPDAVAAGGNGVDASWDETATKLDLAKAYIDMGDAEGARSILDEVLAEGNEQQKRQAAELAAQIA